MRAQQERSEQALHIEKLKEDIKQRYTQELSQKSQETIRTENFLNERISLLEKEVSKLEVSLLQSKQIETDLREKCEGLRQKNDGL